MLRVQFCIKIINLQIYVHLEQYPAKELKNKIQNKKQKKIKHILLF